LELRQRARVLEQERVGYRRSKVVETMVALKPAPAGTAVAADGILNLGKEVVYATQKPVARRRWLGDDSAVVRIVGSNGNRSRRWRRRSAYRRSDARRRRG